MTIGTARAATATAERFLDKVLGRASYLRPSSRKVRRRLSPQRHQIEAFELFNQAAVKNSSRMAMWWPINGDGGIDDLTKPGGTHLNPVLTARHS